MESNSVKSLTQTFNKLQQQDVNNENKKFGKSTLKRNANVQKNRKKINSLENADVTPSTNKINVNQTMFKNDAKGNTNISGIKKTFEQKTTDLSNKQEQNVINGASTLDSSFNLKDKIPPVYFNIQPKKSSFSPSFKSDSDFKFLLSSKLEKKPNNEDNKEIQTIYSQQDALSPDYLNLEEIKGSISDSKDMKLLNQEIPPKIPQKIPTFYMQNTTELSSSIYSNAQEIKYEMVTQKNVSNLRQRENSSGFCSNDSNLPEKEIKDNYGTQLNVGEELEEFEDYFTVLPTTNKLDIRHSSSPVSNYSNFPVLYNQTNLDQQGEYVNSSSYEIAKNKNVENEVSDITYDQSSSKFKNSQDTSFFNNQSEDSFSDFDSDEDWNATEYLILEKKLITDAVKNKIIPLSEIFSNPVTRKFGWVQVVEHMLSNHLGPLPKNKINIQEAKYNLISSEWSYFKALEVLECQFINKIFILLSEEEQNILFGNIKELKDCSTNLLNNIEECWQNNIFLDNLLQIICECLENMFRIYSEYFANQIYSEHLLGELISDKSRSVKDLLMDIQRDPICNGLHLHAYLLLPTRKINTVFNLLENIFQYLSPNDTEYELCKKVMYVANELLTTCNDASKKAKQHLKTKEVLKSLEFPKNSLLLIPEKNGFMRIISKFDQMDLLELSSSLFGKRVIKKEVHVYLFNDLLIITKKMNSKKFTVIDYCFRINIDINTDTSFIHITHGNIDVDKILYLNIRENQNLKKTEMILSCRTKTDAIRWLEALDPPDTRQSKQSVFNNSSRKIIVQRNYTAVQSDELNLIVGEVYHVLRETDDGWFFGQRIKDGECGWFRNQNVLPIDNVRDRVNKVKQKYQMKVTK